VAKVFYPSVHKNPMMSYVYLRLNFDCTTGRSLIELYTGIDMGLTFVHRPNGYADVFLQDYRGSRDLVTLMGACWLAVPIPRTQMESTDYIII
jgi:hypothetical protein